METLQKTEISVSPQVIHERCRYCNSPSVNRIPRGKLVKELFFWLPIRHYICYRCIRTFYRKKITRHAIKQNTLQ